MIMEAKKFLQTCINNGTFTITKKEFAVAMKLSDNEAFSTLKKLSKVGYVHLMKKGKYSYWWITLSNEGPYIAKHAQDEPEYLNSNLFIEASIESMKHNHVMKTVFPDTYSGESTLEQDMLDNGMSINTF